MCPPSIDLIERARTLYNDTHFTAVQAWKEKTNRKAIGYLPMYVPREIIHAAGMLPVGIVGHGDIEIIHGDAYFQSYICHLPRSIIEQGVAKHLDCLDGMLFPSTCDVIRNLSGMWQILFPKKYVKYFELPQNFHEQVGGQFYMQELQRMRHDFEKLAGKQISDDDLRASITVFNENRRLIQKLYAARSKTPWLYGAMETYLIIRAGCLLPVEEHNQLLADYLTQAAQATTAPLDNIRVVVSGAFCEQPPLGMIQTIERAGCYIVDDDFLWGLRWIKGDIPLDGPLGDDPMWQLVHGFLKQSAPCASLYRVDGRHGEDLIEKVHNTNADGVIFAAPSFCDPALLDQPMKVTALEHAGVPFTAFKYAENTGQFQVIREQAGTFADSIKLWGEA